MDHTDEPTEGPRRLPRPPGRELRLWLASLALAAPALLLYVSHFAAYPPGRLPTGFLMEDMPYYLANAREHFDNGRFRLLYSNPFDPRYEAPAIYVQPMSLALGAIIHATGIRPDRLFVAFEVIAAWACARVALALYAEVVGLHGRARRLGLVAFFWGGGLLALAGIAVSLLTLHTVVDVFRFDPGGGWWFLNFGRNLIFPTEALYHGLFFGCILCLLRRRFLAAAGLAALVSASHPFTGVELLLVLASWSALELFFVRRGAAPGGFCAATAGLLALHVGYYLVYLASFPEHRTLMAAWTLPWELRAENFVPAYVLVGALASWSFRRLDLARRFFERPRNRLFLTWFVVAFALANHEFAVRPIQPLHFTRGYIWTPLFLMGAAPLVGLFAALRRRGGPVVGRAAVGMLLALLLLDNALWLGRFPLAAMAGRPAPGLTVTADQLALYRWLCRDENRGALLLTGDPELGYLASVYTPLRSWTGHYYNTPDIATRMAEIASFLEEGRMVDAWRERSLRVVIDRASAEGRQPPAKWGRPVYENAGFLVYRLDPGRPGPAERAGVDAP